MSGWVCFRCKRREEITSGPPPGWEVHMGMHHKQDKFLCEPCYPAYLSELRERAAAKPDKSRCVHVEVEEIELEGDYARCVPSVSATCTRCGDTTESYGTGERSVRRCLALLREGCSREEDNYYSEVDGEDQPATESEASAS